MADKYVKLDDVMNAIGKVPKRKDSPYPTPIHLAAERIIKGLKSRINKIPTGDVVEVVRCKKCRHRLKSPITDREKRPHQRTGR